MGQPAAWQVGAWGSDKHSSRDCAFGNRQALWQHPVVSLGGSVTQFSSSLFQKKPAFVARARTLPHSLERAVGEGRSLTTWTVGSWPRNLSPALQVWDGGEAAVGGGCASRKTSWRGRRTRGGSRAPSASWAFESQEGGLCFWHHGPPGWRAVVRETAHPSQASDGAWQGGSQHQGGSQDHRGTVWSLGHTDSWLLSLCRNATFPPPPQGFSVLKRLFTSPRGIPRGAAGTSHP